MQRFWIIKKLCLYFLFCHRVSSSRYVFLENQILPKTNYNNVLEKFIVRLKSEYLEKYAPRHVMIVSASTNDIIRVQSLFNSYSCIICTNSKEFRYSEEFSDGNFVIIFLNDMRKETFEENVQILSLCENCNVLFMSDHVAQIKEIQFILNMASERNVIYAGFAHLGDNFVKLYSKFVSKNCSTEVRLITVWRPGIDLGNIDKWAFQLRNMNGCLIHVSSLIFKPKMMISSNENGSLTIEGGRDGDMILALAEKLNFTVSLRYPSEVDRETYSRKMSIVNDVATGIAEIGIGRLRPTNSLLDTVAISVPYDDECITWGVPRVMSYSNDILSTEFSPTVWAWICLVFTVRCIIGCIHHSMNMSRNDHTKRKNRGFITTFFDVVAIHLGNPVVDVFSTAGGRFLLIVYLYYVIVMTTAYRTSLAAILATDGARPTIVNAEGIIKANLTVGGSLYDFNILKDQSNDSKLIPTLMNRFEVNNNDTVTWHKLKHDGNYAFLTRRSSLMYQKYLAIIDRQPDTFDYIDGCVLSHHTVIVYRKKSALREPIDNVIMRLTESGLPIKWDLDEIKPHKTLTSESRVQYHESREMYKFGKIFIFYFACVILCLVIFLLELIIPRLVAR